MKACVSFLVFMSFFLILAEPACSGRKRKAEELLLDLKDSSQQKAQKMKEPKGKSPPKAAKESQEPYFTRGIYYAIGLGYPQNSQLALDCFFLAGKYGNKAALVIIDPRDHSIFQNPKDAQVYLAKGFYRLASAYMSGVNSNILQNLVKADIFYKHAAQLGYTPPQDRLDFLLPSPPQPQKQINQEQRLIMPCPPNLPFGRTGVSQKMSTLRSDSERKTQNRELIDLTQQSPPPIPLQPVTKAPPRKPKKARRIEGKFNSPNLPPFLKDFTNIEEIMYARRADSKFLNALGVSAKGDGNNLLAQIYKNVTTRQLNDELNDLVRLKHINEPPIIQFRPIEKINPPQVLPLIRQPLARRSLPNPPTEQDRPFQDQIRK